MDDIPPFITCGLMRQIADELEFGQRSYKIMENESITTLENLGSKQSQLQKLLDKEKDDRQKRTYEKLIHVAFFGNI
jgi:Holliday junction resolvasome RuvABC DNA-binding subunit